MCIVIVYCILLFVPLRESWKEYENNKHKKKYTEKKKLSVVVIENKELETHNKLQHKNICLECNIINNIISLAFYSLYIFIMIPIDAFGW